MVEDFENIKFCAVIGFASMVMQYFLKKLFLFNNQNDNLYVRVLMYYLVFHI